MDTTGLQIYDTEVNSNIVVKAVSVDEILISVEEICDGRTLQSVILLPPHKARALAKYILEAAWDL